MKLTDFLDPRQQQIVTMVIGQGDVAVQFDGATSQAERKRALIYPDYLVINEEEFQVEVLKLTILPSFIR